MLRAGTAKRADEFLRSQFSRDYEAAVFEKLVRLTKRDVKIAKEAMRRELNWRPKEKRLKEELAVLLRRQEILYEALGLLEDLRTVLQGLKGLKLGKSSCHR